MKLQPPANPNYAAVVVRIRTLIPLNGLDNLVGAPLLGYQAIVLKEVNEGDLGVLFTAETQLSEEYARLNNLHRHENLNDDPSKTGYLEDNRRVKAIKFRGNRSDALFMSLESLSRWVDPSTLNEGDTFDELDNHEICRKYVVRRKGYGPNVAKVLKQTRVEEKLFPEHFDTGNYFRNIDKFNSDDYIYVTQKLHGTSIRIGHTVVQRRLKWYEKLAKKFGVGVQQYEYDYVFGSRNVIKDANDPNQKNFYATDLYSNEGKKLQGLLPKGYLLFGELIGWTPENVALQPQYTYCVPEGRCELYIYRVAFINPDGQMVDLGWNQVKEFCINLGLKYVPELWRGEHIYFNVNCHLDKRFNDWNSNAVPVGPEGTKLVDEGVCIRRDGLTPLVLKAKSPMFLEHETKMLDKGEVDMEEDQLVDSA